MTIRSFLPDSLLSRTVIVLILAVVVSLGAALALFAGQRSDALAALDGHHAAERVLALVRLLEDTAPSHRRLVLYSTETKGFRVGWGVSPLVEQSFDSNELSQSIRRRLQNDLKERDIRISIRDHRPMMPPTWDTPPASASFSPSASPPRHPRHRHAENIGMIHGPMLCISVQLGDGSWLNVAAPLEPHYPLWRWRFLAPLGVSLVVVVLIAVWAVRRATRPLATFAAAAERLGVDVNAPPLPEVGPWEIRHASQAFNQMQDRIRRFVDDRTRMLAAISHDLRTPITRLRLRAEFVEDDQERQKMLDDLDEMERMITATLAFARDDTAQERVRAVDLASVIQGLVEDLSALGKSVDYKGPETLVMRGKPLALKRGLLSNLLDNAIQYGGCAHVNLSTEGTHVVLTIDDDGQGISEADRERVFSPFVRLETSRNRNTGGTGLGLSIARTVARVRGGDITLSSRPEGGTRAKVVLPFTPP